MGNTHFIPNARVAMGESLRLPGKRSEKANRNKLSWKTKVAYYPIATVSWAR